MSVRWKYRDVLDAQLARAERDREGHRTQRARQQCLSCRSHVADINPLTGLPFSRCRPCRIRLTQARTTRRHAAKLRPSA